MFSSIRRRLYISSFASGLVTFSSYSKSARCEAPSTILRPETLEVPYEDSLYTAPPALEISGSKGGDMHDVLQLSPNRIMELTILKTDLEEVEIRRLVHKAVTYHLKAVVVHAYWVELARETLRHVNMDREIGISAVVGFPYGLSGVESKRSEALAAVRGGASGIEMVVNVGAVKSSKWSDVESEISKVSSALREFQVPLTVTVETNLLTKHEIVKVCQAAARGGAQAVKTCTGSSCNSVATFHDIRLMRSIVGRNFSVYAAGGIRSMQQVYLLVNAGADFVSASQATNIVDSLSSEALISLPGGMNHT